MRLVHFARVRVLVGTVLVLLALAGEARAAMFFSGENATGVSSSGVGALHAHISSTSGLVYTAQFDFGLTTAYGTTIAGATGANNVPSMFNGNIDSVAITGLACGTVYHWRLDVTAAGTGTDQTLTTSACVTVSPASKSYGSVATGGSSTQTFMITNTSAGNIQVSGISSTGADAAMFGVTAGTCGSLTPTITSGSGCTVSVAFAPSSTGAKSATLRVASDAPDSPVDVALTGTGGAGGSVPTLSEWGMILLALLFIGALALTSRRSSGGKPA
jgi:hypothetical protein